MRKSALIPLSSLLFLTISFFVFSSSVFAWSEERPDSASVPIDVYFKERDEDCNTNGYVAVGLGIGIHKFEEEHQPYPSDYDIVTLNVSATANARYGLSYDYNWISFWWIPENLWWSWKCGV